MNLQGKKVLLAVCGSIAAYKSVFLVRLLIKAGAEVKVLLTQDATEFVAPLTFSTLSRNAVIVGLSNKGEWENHVALGLWADVLLIAPATCNTIAKMANGVCDSVVLAVYLSARCKVVVAPAMDVDMWLHPSTQRNIQLIRKDGVDVVSVQHGELASGLIGEGRMAEPEHLVAQLTYEVFRTDELKGRKVLVNGGPTYESIDPVRFLGNHSSGKMGFSLAKAFYKRGADVVLVSGPTKEKMPIERVQFIGVTSASEMHDACLEKLKESDIFVLSAAVADYTPVLVHNQKIKKKEGRISIELEKTKDILAAIGHAKRIDQYLVGFALETNDESQYARTKLKSKNADLIVMNSLRDEKAGFGHDTNRVVLFDKDGGEVDFALASKDQIADQIVSYIIHKFQKNGP